MNHSIIILYLGKCIKIAKNYIFILRSINLSEKRVVLQTGFFLQCAVAMSSEQRAAINSALRLGHQNSVHYSVVSYIMSRVQNKADSITGKFLDFYFSSQCKPFLIIKQEIYFPNNCIMKYSEKCSNPIFEKYS